MDRTGDDTYMRRGRHDYRLLGSGARTCPNPQNIIVYPFIMQQAILVSHILTLLLPLVGAATISKRGVDRGTFELQCKGGEGACNSAAYYINCITKGDNKITYLGPDKKKQDTRVGMPRRPPPRRRNRRADGNIHQRLSAVSLRHEVHPRSGPPLPDRG
jgi:hypothetical protein